MRTCFIGMRVLLCAIHAAAPAAGPSGMETCTLVIVRSAPFSLQQLVGREAPEPLQLQQVRQ